jgi:hypothetical protein
MAGSYVVYGRNGTGSVPVEATLLLLGQPYILDRTISKFWTERFPISSS